MAILGVVAQSSGAIVVIRWRSGLDCTPLTKAPEAVANPAAIVMKSYKVATATRVSATVLDL
jgi:hypothetical protein